MTFVLSTGVSTAASDALYEIKKTEPKVAVGATATASLTITAKSGWHVNGEAPISVALTAPAGVTLQKLKLTRSDLAQSTPEAARFDIPRLGDRGGQEDDQRRGAVRAVPGAGVQAGEGDARACRRHHAGRRRRARAQGHEEAQAQVAAAPRAPGYSKSVTSFSTLRESDGLSAPTAVTDSRSGSSTRRATSRISAGRTRASARARFSCGSARV